jgi:cob(I)alamin adenosyltransferase
MKIYTKTGDKGKTMLYGGLRVSKSADIIHALGDIDELNSYIGIIISDNKVSKLNEIKELFLFIQNDLFDLGADIASSNIQGKKLTINRIDKENIEYLEKKIDYFQTNLPELKNFILPGGDSLASKVFYCRSICRRAERSVVNSYEDNELNSNILIYLNRLSDLFFVIARYINKKFDCSEIIWNSK